MQPIVRIAEKDEMPQVLELIQELADFEKEPDAVAITADDLKEAGYGETPLFRCFVAEVDNTIVGMALVYFRFSTWKGRTLHLEDLVVKDSMRGKGVGESLYKEVMNYGRTEGVKRIQWEVLGWNKGAIKFYERTGANVLYDWHVVHMHEDGLKHYLREH
ncbi:GNAT family N-acetyltransferase [Cochleicola gelatinilyticus]|uniref:GNAT family acetyltransferase n=1 Tax=Cochleicola gelatinilyticus TaxID=1763537 RepID=A0A167J869_9FLAO|nr:GNAT family N-acetyltransferase [Cochleicola gelatinilyticus]OAB80418.1 GNAT family acetyltransferase [Cochleicola gelatinilyticus]